jgi:hypothetical protein
MIEIGDEQIEVEDIIDWIMLEESQYNIAFNFDPLFLKAHGIITIYKHSFTL